MINHKIYVAGPMNGFEDFNRPAFNVAAKDLRSKGFSVMNPAELPDGFSDNEYMSVCVSMIQCCGYIYMLQGWKESKGATAEYHLAVKLGLNVLEETL